MNVEPENKGTTSGGGSNRPLLIKVVVLIAVLGGLLCLTKASSEPSYGGRSLSSWLKRYEEVVRENGDENDPRALECRAAIRHIGTNAIPSLLKMLRAKDSRVKLEAASLAQRAGLPGRHFSMAEDNYSEAMLGFHCLDELATNAIPTLMGIYNNPPSPYAQEVVDSVLVGMYPAGGTATPSWVPLDERADWYFRAGQMKSGLKEGSNALLAFSESIKLNPTNAPVYLSRAAEKIQLKDFSGALDDANQSIALYNSNETAFYTRGLCKFALKDFKNAETDFTTAITLNTNYIEAYNYRGLARGALRKVDDALADFNKAVEMAPRNAMVHRNRAMVETMQKEYELALADVTMSIDLGGKDATAYVVRGRINSVLKEYQSAISDFDMALTLNPKDSSAYSGRGAAKIYSDDFEGGSKDVEMALQMDPKSVTAYAARGILTAKRGGDGQAVLADFARAVELGPQMPETRAMLGLFQYRYSQWVPALENCRKALKTGALSATSDLRSYIWLIRAQTGEEAGANQELKTYLDSLEGAKTNEWEASIARFLSGGLTESNFLHQATTTAKRPSAISGQVCESLYYAGMKHKLAGDKLRALELFQLALNTKADNNLGYMNAGVEIRALKGQ